MRPSVLYFFFTCLTPNDFTRQWETLQLIGLTKKSDNVSGKPIEPQCALLIFLLDLSNARRFYSSMGKLCSLIKDNVNVE